MHRKPMTLVTRAAALWVFGLLSLAECAWGQSNCKQVKADFSISVPPGPPPKVASGTITNGGDLNGTVRFVDTVATGSATPDPMVVSYSQDIIITTHEGQLTATSVHIFDFANLLNLTPFGLDTSIQRIGPTSAKTGNLTNTGRFAGATGFYFMNGVVAPAPDGSFTGQGQLTGQVCYAADGASSR